MVKKYYLKEMLMIGLLAWCITINIKLNNVVGKVEVLKVELETFGFDLKGISLAVTKMQQDNEDFNNLDFSEAFKVMYDMYGEHHLFVWRGRVYTTDLDELRNITISPVEEREE